MHAFKHNVAAVALRLSFPLRLFYFFFSGFFMCSYDLMSRLHASDGRCRFHLAVGADLLPQLGSWRHAEALLRRVSFLGLPRPASGASSAPSAPAAAPTRLPAHFVSLEAASDDPGTTADPPPPLQMLLSSTEARARLRSTSPVASASRLAACVGLLSPPVLAHIAVHSLYC